jgi:hypothetical protein
MESAISSAGIGRTDTDGDANPTARSLLKYNKVWSKGVMEQWSNGNHKNLVILGFYTPATLAPSTMVDRGRAY